MTELLDARDALEATLKDAAGLNDASRDGVELVVMVRGVDIEEEGERERVPEALCVAVPHNVVEGVVEGVLQALTLAQPEGPALPLAAVEPDAPICVEESVKVDDGDGVGAKGDGDSDSDAAADELTESLEDGL